MDAENNVAQAILAAYPDILVKGWGKRVREDAAERFTALGAPKKLDEYWRYGTPSAFLDAVNDPKSAIKESAAPLFDLEGAAHIRFQGGHVKGALPDLPGLTCERFSEVENLPNHWAEGLFGALEAKGQNPVARSLAALNTAKAQDGLVLHIRGNVSSPLYITHAAGGAHMLRHLIKLEANASLLMVEEMPMSGRSNIVIEADLAAGATLTLLRLQAESDQAVRGSHSFVRLGEKSDFQSLVLAAGGGKTRSEVIVDLDGAGARARMGCAYIGKGSEDHHDDTVFVTHRSEDCESRQVFKKVLDGGATGVFQGKILVEEEAQRTDGYQISQGLLLSDESAFLAKPELEIYADDVACSHGSTVGAIDEEALFYLTSRGIPRKDARDLLILSFLGECLEELDDTVLQEKLRDLLTDWLS